MNFFENKAWQNALWPLAKVYNQGIQARNWCFDKGLFHRFAVDAFVVSIGNLTVGGTGKTPAAIFLANTLQKKGYKVGILSRGYGRNTKKPVLVCAGNGPVCSVGEAGDEPYLMALKTQNVCILADANRVRGARWLVQNFSVNLILLDDGFQHRHLQRDIDLVLFDPVQYLKNPKLLPAGPFRETLSALSRAGFVWFICSNGKDEKSCQRIREKIRKLFPGQIGNARILASHLWDPVKRRREPIENLKDAKVYGFAGIGQPGKFLNMLNQAGARIVGFDKYPDHKQYHQQDIKILQQRFFASGADVLITTFKDWVKLADFKEMRGFPLKILEITFLPDQESLESLFAVLKLSGL